MRQKGDVVEYWFNGRIEVGVIVLVHEGLQRYDIDTVDMFAVERRIVEARFIVE